jgi:proline iminopeptidase
MTASDAETGGRYVDIGDTRLYVVERGEGGYPLLVFHGGPGLDHHSFGDYLDALADEYRLILVDQRSNGRSDRTPEETWTLQQMAADVGSLARALDLERYAVLGHSYGAFVVLQHAVDFPGDATQTIVSSGVPSTRFLEQIAQNLAAFEPIELREQVTDSWEREKSVRTQEEVAELLHDQWPFQFADPRDPRIEEYERRTARSIYSTDVLRRFASEEYGGIEIEDRLGDVTQPVLVLAGRHDRTCVVEAAQTIAEGVPRGELVVFESSGHMTFVEENDAYVRTVRDFLKRHVGASSQC